MKRIHDINGLTKKDASQYGGKAAHLGELMAMGLQVPPGFCIGHEVLSSLVNGAGERADQATLPERLMDTIRPWFDDLMSKIGNGQAGLAVRSSAIGEDSSLASFAGQFESVLGPSTLEELCRAIIFCWNSLKSGRAVSYVKRKGVAAKGMSVIVQELVIPKAAGVCFTCHPVTLDKRTFVVESNWGFANTVVAGLVTPDHFEVNIVSRTVDTEFISRKRTMAKLVDKSVKLVPISDELQISSSLNREELWQIVDGAISVHQQFNSPQDIEWALCDGGLFIVQTRPITTILEKF
jgi:phosphoenolpyruvate synthase/pyruvate phosphate dikinase